MFVIFVLLTLVKAVRVCIPTQQVDITTTTTPAPGPATPCVTCQKIYDTSCVGYVAGQSWCSAASSVSITYEIGQVYTDETFHYYEDGACIMSFTCPSGTTVVVDVLSGTAPVDEYGYNTGYCLETGTGAGQWYYGVYGLTEFEPAAMRSIKCVG